MKNDDLITEVMILYIDSIINDKKYSIYFNHCYKIPNVSKSYQHDINELLKEKYDIFPNHFPIKFKD